MADFIGDWAVKLSANANGLVQGLDDAAKRTATFAQQARATTVTAATGVNSALSSITGGRLNLSQHTQQFAGMANAISGVGAAVATGGLLAGVGAFVSLTSAVIAFGSASMSAINVQAQLGRRLGITAQEAAGLQLIGAQAGIAPDAMSQGLSLWTKQIRELRTEMATPGGGAMTAAMARMGVDARAFAGANYGNQMAMLAEAYQRMPEGMDRDSTVLAILGRRNENMIPMLRENANELRNLGDTAARAGINISQIDARNVMQTTREIRVLQAQLSARAGGVGTGFGVLYSNLLRQAVLNFGGGTASVAQSAFNSLQLNPAQQNQPANAAAVAAQAAAYTAEVNRQTVAVGTLNGALAESARLQEAFNSLPNTDAGVLPETIQRISQRNNLALQNLGLTQRQIEANELIRAGASAEQLMAAEARASALEAGQQNVQNRNAATEMERSLATQMLTMNMTAGQAAIYRLELQGATSEMTRQAERLNQQLEREQQLHRMRQQGQQIAEQLQNPVESFQARINELMRLQAEGAIGAETFGRGIAGAFDQLDRAFPDSQHGGPAALISGSVDAARAIAQAQRDDRQQQRNPMDRVERILEQQRLRTIEQRDLMQRLVDAAEEGFFDVLPD